MAFTGATSGLAAGAQTNDTRMDFALETLYATPPTGNYQALRITGETFSRAQTTSRPQEINALKQVSQSVITQVQASGTISGALSSGTFDDLIAGVMGADWMATPASSYPSVVVATGNNVQISYGQSANAGQDSLWSHTTASAAGSVFVTWPASGIVRITDATNGIDIFATYQSIKTGGTTLIFAQGSFRSVYGIIAGMGGSNSQSADLSPGSTITLVDIVNSNIDKTFTIRKKLLGKFLHYPGSLITQVQIQLQQGQFGTISIDAICADEVKSDTDIASSVLAAPGGKVHNTVNNFLGATINGQAPAGCVTQFTCTLARDGNGNDYGNGHASACGVRTGQFTASGSIEFYFRTWDEYDAALAGTQGPIVVKSVDDSGNGYAFIFTNAALRNAKVNTSETNQTVKASFDIEGNPTEDGGPTFAISRLTGVAATGS
ncbi:phage tail protein [Acetobacter tropicalis]|uniref:Phage tail protein n=1 Tax=Acetobacter tropicalis TaxID=104102 RepID=A0A291PGQ5_9PROT|nr:MULTISPECIES: phage tail tube protein [Acetobacter]ATJ90662.1 phage tail protein [Acetobacter tropicalis]